MAAIKRTRGRPSTQVESTCQQCGKPYLVRLYMVGKTKFCSCACKAEHDRNRIFVSDADLKGHSGYRVRVRNGKRVREHRMVVENTIGRKLLPTELVHHENSVRSDNSPGNLEITDKREHGLLHNPPVHPVTSTCVVCGGEFTPHKTKRWRKKTCSKACMSELLKRQWAERRATPSPK